MKKLSKLLALVLALGMLLSLAACNKDSGSSNKKYVVGICQLLPHAALNAATEAFKDALKDAFGDNVEIKEGNAGGDPANCTTIIDGFVSDKVDLILANATPSLTAADNTSTIADVVIPAKVPVIAGEEGICSGCGVATLSISYYEIGHIAGEMAVQILKGEKKVSELAIGFDTTLDKKYNASICQQLGLTMPADYVAIGD